MTRFTRRLTATLLIGLCFLVSAVPQTTEPPWLKIERADRLADDGRYGLAIQLYREALAQSPASPEALFGLGRAFKAVSDYPVAEQYLHHAIDLADKFFVPDARYAVAYDLAELYRVQRRFAEYEQTLTMIVEWANDQSAAESGKLPGRTNLARVFSEFGMDRLLVLYRLPEDGATKARVDLAELLVGLGRYDQAVSYAVMAAVQQLSTVVDDMLERDPDFEFVRITEAMAVAETYPETREYLTGSELNRTLYFLAAAVYGEGDAQTARDVWLLLRSLPHAGTWGTRAGIQLDNPQTEPLLIPPE